MSKPRWKPTWPSSPIYSEKLEEITHPDVDEAFISGHDNLRLQKAKGGRSSGAGWTGERCRNEPCLGEIMLSIPLDEVRRRDPGNGAVADGDGTFSQHLGKEQQGKIDSSWDGIHLRRPVNPSIIYHFRKSCKGDKSEKFPWEKYSVGWWSEEGGRQTEDNWSWWKFNKMRESLFSSILFKSSWEGNDVEGFHKP